MRYPIHPSLAAHYEQFIQTMALRGLQGATIDAYGLGLRQVSTHFDGDINALSTDQIRAYFHGRLKTNSQSAVNIAHCALSFYYQHVLAKPYPGRGLVNKTKTQIIPDVLSVKEAQAIFNATTVYPYRAFFFTLYSLGLRISEGLKLQVGDIDAEAMRVHVRNAKGNKDRMVPMAPSTLFVLRDFWSTHRNTSLLFPRRNKCPKLLRMTDRAMDVSGIGKALRLVCTKIGVKKRSALTAFATATPLT